jgi:hypothetical protein
VLQFARTMTWKGTHPVVELVTTTYRTDLPLPFSQIPLKMQGFVYFPYYSVVMYSAVVFCHSWRLYDTLRPYSALL